MSISDAVTLYFWLFLAFYSAVAIYTAYDVWREAEEKAVQPDKSPEPPRISARETLASLEQRLRRSTGHSIMAIVSHALVGIVDVAVLFAFPISMILSRGEPPEWSFQFGAGRLGGSTESLCLFVVGILCFAAAKYLRPKRSKRSDSDLYLRRLFHLMLFAVPFMTILAWSGY